MNYVNDISPSVARFAWSIGFLVLTIAVGLLSVSVAFGGGLAVTLTTATVGILAFAILGLAALVSIESLFGASRRKLQKCFSVASQWALGASTLAGAALYALLFDSPLAGIVAPILIGYAFVAVCFVVVIAYFVTRWRVRST